MSQFNKILDPDSGISYDIKGEKGININNYKKCF